MSNKKIELNCSWCNSIIYRYKCNILSNVFCNNDCCSQYKRKYCKGENHSSYGRKTGKIVLCDFCGNKFYKMLCMVRKHNFCDRSCSGSWKKENFKGKGNPAFGIKRPDLAKYSRENIKRGKDHPSYGKKKLTEDQKNKIREFNKGNKYCVGRIISEETREKIKKTLNSPEVKKKMIEGIKRSFLNGRRKLVHGKWTEYNGIKFRSTWEALYAEYLDNNKMEWKYEERSFDLGQTTYTPDFWIYDKGKFKYLVEIKGYMREDARLKIDLFKEKYDIPFIVLGKDELKELNIPIK